MGTGALRQARSREPCNDASPRPAGYSPSCSQITSTGFVEVEEIDPWVDTPSREKTDEDEEEAEEETDEEG